MEMTSILHSTHKAHKLTYGFIHQSERNLKFIIPDSIIQICLLYLFQFIDEFIKDRHGDSVILQSNKNAPDDRLTEVKPRCHGYASVYGQFIVDFDELRNCIVEWTINAYTNLNNCEVSVGIIEIDAKSHHERLWNQYPFNKTIEKCYGLWIWKVLFLPSNISIIYTSSCILYFLRKLSVFVYRIKILILVVKIKSPISFEGLEINLESGHFCETFYDDDLDIAKEDLEKFMIKMKVDINHAKVTYLLNEKDYGFVFKDIDNEKKYQLVIAVYGEASLRMSHFDVKYNS